MPQITNIGIDPTVALHVEGSSQSQDTHRDLTILGSSLTVGVLHKFIAGLSVRPDDPSGLLINGQPSYDIQVLLYVDDFELKLKVYHQPLTGSQVLYENVDISVLPQTLKDSLVLAAGTHYR